MTLSIMKRITFLSAIIFAVFASVAIVSCSKLDNPSTGHHDRLQAILLGKDTLEMYVGETRQVPIVLSPSNYDEDSLKWTSSDTSVLTISTVGIISAKKVGASTVSVSNLTNTISVHCLVTVVPAPTDSLKIGLIAYYPFDNSAADSSGNGYDGTLANVTPTQDRFGNENSAYHFSGDSSSYISVNDNHALRLHNTDFSINVWVKLDTYNTSFGDEIVCKRYPGNNNGYSYSISGYENTVAPLGSYGFGPGGTSPGGTSNSTINLNQWYMLTVVYSLAQQQLTFYKNGVFDGSSANDVASPDGSSNAVLYIGKDDPQNPTSYFINGTLDDIRIYGKMISVDEIQKLYNLTR